MWNRRGEINSEDVMDNNNKKIIKERCFLLGGEKFIARLYIPPKNKNFVYGEIVYKKDKKRPNSMKDIVRQYLRPHGIEIPTDARRVVTHSAVKMLIDFLEGNC
jgi:hypothetical protein